MTESGDRQDTDDYLNVFLSGAPLLDTRAPVEFHKGAFPDAVNLPLMTDDERAQVGSCYKRHGQQAAITLGHRLVHGEVKEARVQGWREFAQRHPQGYLYCFRGGLRSSICQQWLAESGVAYPRILGGYKAMRRFLIESLERICQEARFVLLAGHTGGGKTDLLMRLPGAVDLERLAHHRGSAFGRRAEGQPSQIDFENALAVAVLRQRHGFAEAPLLLEDESHLIGRCALPQCLRRAMAQAPLVVVEVALEQRVEHSFRNYILHKLHEWRRSQGEEEGFERFADDLRQSMFNIRTRLGGLRYQQLGEMLEAALARHRRGDPVLHRDWIRCLLEDYYDPMYAYQLNKRAERICFRGDAAAVCDYLAHASPTMTTSRDERL
ncbi:tRNA 2-selenouridine(34) synthase MnmH [Hahella sp. NBU794]|uniref:tRNA 2-selenouridine(34) synthase MnmH n=1 Tax=Hahella sp. NBU794 TaxID=3422590 RepID=UPI003D6FA036